MIVSGSLNSNKTELLIERYVRLIDSGVEPQNILFLVQNAYKKNKNIKKIKAFLPHINPNVQTFLGLCYNSVLNNKKILDEKLPKSLNDEYTLCGLETSQHLLLEAIKEVGFKDYNSKINLVHQLLRRHSLIVNNNLNDKEVEEKSLILNEEFSQDAKKALDLFKKKTLELRVFDYLRQQSLFKWLYENTDCCKEIKYILIDDYDEQTPACCDFFNFIKPKLIEYYVGIDKNGSSRMGYLCANLDNSILKKESNVIEANDSKKDIKYEFQGCAKRLEMVNQACKKIVELVDSGVNVDEITIITPLFDKQLKFVLGNYFEKKLIDFQFVSGSEKLSDDNFIRSVLNLLKLINNTQKDIFSNTDILNNIFPTLIGISPKYSSEIIKKFQTTKGFVKYDFKDENINKNYERFLSIPELIDKSEVLSVQLRQLYKYFISQRENTEEELANYDFLIKQIKDLEFVSNGVDKARILNQIGNSIISENDEYGQKIKQNAILIGTPQKIIDLEIKSKYQIWLDISSDEWIKQDTGTIYNAWVFSKSWKKKEFTYQDSIDCVNEKTKRILRKLNLLVQEKVFAFSSNYNSLGLENNIGITQFLSASKNEQQNIITTFKFTPRNDQKAIMEYTEGKMALSAVPGAGKTTVLQALILKLISDGVAPENIFVLTYMESAAKTLKDRLLKSMITNEEKNTPDVLPNISTIHGLALRIIKENANYSKVNLSEDFEICDEVLRQKIIREIISELNLNHENYEKFEKAISVLKFVNINSTIRTKEIKEFLSLYRKYKDKLAQKNLIDYDDMLILSVKILEDNPQILKHYQTICSYILEDEAQDSSEIQQKLINLLAGKNGNVIRCGDINQAITSTFTNSDIKGFKDFIQNNKSVEMDHSQRCAKGIFELANNLVDVSNSQNSAMNGAFYNIKMKEVEGKNPISETPIIAKIYEDEQAENFDIINKIKNIFNLEPMASVAILVRNNFQVNKYSSLLKQNGLSVIARSDALEQCRIFNILLAILKFCIYSWKNNLVNDVYKLLFNQKEDNLFFENLETQFTNFDVTKLDDEKLISLHWELNYWLNNNSLPLEQLALLIGEYYCENTTERSNLYIIAELIRRFSQNSNSYTEIISKLEQVAKRPTIAGLKLFSDDDSKLYTTLGGTVQIMTMHKSKGDEFDFVFIPELSEKSIGTNLNSIKVGSNIGFFEEIKSLDKKYRKKTFEELKKEVLHENLRLFYVAITRAKRHLFFSCARKQKIFGRLRDVEVSELFDSLLSAYLM